MKLLAMLSVGLLAAAAVQPVPATAQPRHGYHGGHGWRTRTVCRTERRHHRRVRICRKVRVRR